MWAAYAVVDVDSRLLRACVQVLYISDQLSSDDYGTVLQPLMRYPPVEDVRDILATAMALRAGAAAARGGRPRAMRRARRAGRAVAPAAAYARPVAASAGPGAQTPVRAPSAPPRATTPAATEGAVHAGIAAVAAADAAHAERLHAFYMVHNPTKLGDVPKILAQCVRVRVRVWMDACGGRAHDIRAYTHMHIRMCAGTADASR